MKLFPLTFLMITPCLTFLALAEDNAPTKRPKHHGERPNPIEMYDTNNDGSLTIDEFSQARKIAHLDEEQIEVLFTRLDKNNDSVLDEREIRPPKKHKHMKDGKPRHAELDTDNDKKVSLEEFLSDKPDDQKERHEKIFRMLDRNNDNFLSREDRPRENSGDRPHKRPHKGFKEMMMKRLDTDGDETISLEEFKQAERNKDHDDEKVQEIFNRLDTNQNGVIDEDDAPPAPRKPRH